MPFCKCYFFLFQTKAALIYDAINIFSTVYLDLEKTERMQAKPLSCHGTDTYDHGLRITEFMKVVSKNTNQNKNLRNRLVLVFFASRKVFVDWVLQRIAFTRNTYQFQVGFLLPLFFPRIAASKRLLLTQNVQCQSHQAPLKTKNYWPPERNWNAFTFQSSTAKFDFHERFEIKTLKKKAGWSGQS